MRLNMKKPILNEEILRLRKIMGLNENFEMPSKEEFNFEKSAIESATGEKVAQREFDDYDRPLYYSLSDDNVHYFIGDGDNGKTIFKYNAKTGERYPVGDLKDYDSPMRAKDEMDSELFEGDSEEKMVSFDDLLAQDTDGMSPGDQEMIDAHDEEEANKYASKNYDDVESGAIDEDWGSSDQGYMNKMIHSNLNEPTEFNFGMFDMLKNVAEEAVNDNWSDWEEYNTNRDGLVRKAMTYYLRRYFPDWYENVSKMFS
jgi:hypothetical protein